MKPIIELWIRKWTIEEIALIVNLPPQFVVGAIRLRWAK
jgi:hypothetical protein